MSTELSERPRRDGPRIWHCTYLGDAGGLDWNSARLATECCGCSVDSGSVPERDRYDDQVVVADLDQDAVVTDAVPPVGRG